MGFFVKDYSGLIITHILYEAAFVLALPRWALSWALRFKDRAGLPSLGSDHVRQSHPVTSSQQIRECPSLTTHGEITERSSGVCDTCCCAICLSQLSDEVSELRNCCHVFHKECIDRWVDPDRNDDHGYDNHKTCPLCRAPLLTASQSLSWTRSEPSWVVERILYLFADDFLT